MPLSRYGEAAAEARRALLARGESIRLTLRGGSMFPFLLPGDVVEIADRRYSPGDVLAYVDGEKVFVHRLVEASRDGRLLRLRGDAQREADPWISTDDVLGMLVGVERWGAELNLDSIPSRTAAWLASATVAGLPPFGCFLGALRRIAARMRGRRGAFASVP